MSSNDQTRRSRSSKKKQAKKSSLSRYLRYGWPAFVVGALIVYVFMKWSIGGAVVTVQSNLDFDRTLFVLIGAVQSQGFAYLDTVHLNTAIQKGGMTPPARKFAVITFLDPMLHSKGIQLEGTSTLFAPARIAVWESLDDKKVYITRLGPGLTRRYFGDPLVRGEEAIIEACAPK